MREKAFIYDTSVKTDKLTEILQLLGFIKYESYYWDLYDQSVRGHSSMVQGAAFYCYETSEGKPRIGSMSPAKAIEEGVKNIAELVKELGLVKKYNLTRADYINYKGEDILVKEYGIHTDLPTKVIKPLTGTLFNLLSEYSPVKYLEEHYTKKDGNHAYFSIYADGSTLGSSILVQCIKTGDESVIDLLNNLTNTYSEEFINNIGIGQSVMYQSYLWYLKYKDRWKLSDNDYYRTIHNKINKNINKVKDDLTNLITEFNNLINYNINSKDVYSLNASSSVSITSRLGIRYVIDEDSININSEHTGYNLNKFIRYCNSKKESKLAELHNAIQFNIDKYNYYIQGIDFNDIDSILELDKRELL